MRPLYDCPLIETIPMEDASEFVWRCPERPNWDPASLVVTDGGTAGGVCGGGGGGGSIYCWLYVPTVEMTLLGRTAKPVLLSITNPGGGV